LSTILLEKNANYKIRFWCLEKISDRLVYSVMHNAEIRLIDVQYFRNVINRLISECDDLEEAVAKYL